jgi:hypothetical protein
MGELSDAIREHLELKRRRGADPAEVAREEHDALSPVTRSHPVVVPQAAVYPAAEPQADDAPDATQEFLVGRDEPDEPPSWLDEATG